LDEVNFDYNTIRFRGNDNSDGLSDIDLFRTYAIGEEIIVRIVAATPSALRGSAKPGVCAAPVAAFKRVSPNLLNNPSNREE